MSSKKKATIERAQQAASSALGSRQKGKKPEDESLLTPESTLEAKQALEPVSVPRVKRKWAFDDGGHSSNIPDERPPGYIVGKRENFVNEGESKKEKGDKSSSELVYESAMSLAQQPGKQLFMTAFMLYMSGSTLQIFSIMMVGMALWKPFAALFSVNQQFARYSDSNVDVTFPKLIYFVLNLVGVGVGLYKCQTLGILPSTADWISDVIRKPVEFSAGGVTI